MLISIAPLAGCVLTLLALAVPARAQVSQYTLTDVTGSAPATTTGAAGLSDTGFVCGQTIDSASVSRGFRWSPGSLGAPSSVSFLDPPAGGWGNYDATDVNDAGAVIGTFGGPGMFWRNRGYIWKDGVCQELFTTIGRPALPEAINDAGWIVGFEGEGSSGNTHGLLWDPDLVPTLLPEFTFAYDINERGQIVGAREEDTAGIARGYLLDHGNVIALGTLDPRNRGDVYPLGINESGHVVGESWVGIPPNDRPHAFLWTPATGMTELLGPYPGVTGHARAYAINDAGWIVGQAPAPGGTCCTLWAPDGTATDLETLEVGVGAGTRWASLSRTLNLNNAGQIAGGALTGTRVLTVLLTPASLQASALTPGVAGVSNSLTVSAAHPGKPTFLLGDLDDGLDQGYTRIPGWGPLGLALATPRFVSAQPADGAGQSTHSWLVPSSLAGQQVRLQAFQFADRALSNVVRVAF